MKATALAPPVQILHRNFGGTDTRSAGRPGILVAASPRPDVMACMGAKYQPTIRDLKASERFRQKQVSRPMLTKATSDRPITQAKKAK